MGNNRNRFILRKLAGAAILVLVLINLNSCSSGEFTETEVEFVNSADGVRLSGTLNMPESRRNVPAVVLIHGSGPHTRDLEISGGKKIFRDLAVHLSENGIAVLRYDKRGTGNSGGKYEPNDLENFAGDGIAGVRFLKGTDGIDKNLVGAVGLSQGGIITPLMADQSIDVNFIVMMAGSGLPAYNLILTSQLALSRAAGTSWDDLDEVVSNFNSLWNILIKEDVKPGERNAAIELIKQVWMYIDEESRHDLGFLDENAEFFFDSIYHHPRSIEFYDYDPREVLARIKCPVLAMNCDKDVQVDADPNLSAIKKALENGACRKYEVVKLQDHNHIFQKCETGKVSEYKTIQGTLSGETLNLVTGWIKSL